MLGKGLGSNARKLINAFGTIKLMDVVVPVRRGDMEVKVRLRTVAKPDEDVAVLLSHLGLPSTKPVQNCTKCSGEKRLMFCAKRCKSTKRSFQLRNLG
jgi:hypothetical protein